MSFLSLNKLPRLPFREDKVFSVLVLLTLVVPLVFYWQLYEKFETIKLSFWLVLLGWALITLMVRKVFGKIRPAAVICLGLFLVLGFAASVFSFNHLNSFFGLYPRFTSGFLFYALWALTLLLMLATLNREKWEFLVRIVFFDAVIVAISGILQTLGIGYYEGINQPFIARAPGLLGNPNFSSMFLAAAMPFALPLILRAKTFAARVYYGLGGVLMLFAIINFSSRGAFVALAAGLIFGVFLAAVLKFSKKIIFILGFVSLACLGLIFTVSGLARPNALKGLFQTPDINIDYRLFAWDVARQAIMQHPFLGYGPGNTQVYFERYRGSNLVQGGGEFDDVHNLFLQMAVSSGIPFALSFLTLCGFAVWYAYKRLKADKTDDFTAASLTALLIWAAAACFNPVSTANFLLLAIILAGMLLYQSNSEIKSVPILRALMGLFGIIAILLGISLLSGELMFFEAQKDYLQFKFPQSSKWATAAMRVNPTNQLYYLYNAADKVILGESARHLEADARQIIALQPQSAKSQVMAANLFYLLYNRTNDVKDLKSAIAYMDNSLQLDKYYAPRWGHAAFYLAENKQLDLAREYAKSGVALDPSHLPSWLLLARIYQLQNKPEQMRYALNEAFKLKPDDPNLKNLNETAKKETDISKLQIPAIINFLQIEP